MRWGLRIKGVDLVLNPSQVLYYLHAMLCKVLWEVVCEMRSCAHAHTSRVYTRRQESEIKGRCHGMTSLPLLHLPLAASDLICLHPPLPPPLHSNSNAYLHNLYDYVTPTLGLTADQCWTHLVLVPMPRAAVYIPFPHLFYLPDPFSLTIAVNYPFLV